VFCCRLPNLGATMGNAQCCTSADTGEDAAGEAMPKVETWPPSEVGPPGAGHEGAVGDDPGVVHLFLGCLAFSP